MFLFKVFEKIAEQVIYHVIDAEAIQFIACENLDAEIQHFFQKPLAPKGLKHIPKGSK